MSNRKLKFTCQGGPMAGVKLWLSAIHPYTIVFNYGGRRGRYVCEKVYGSFKTENRYLQWQEIPNE